MNYLLNKHNLFLQNLLVLLLLSSCGTQKSISVLKTDSFKTQSLPSTTDIPGTNIKSEGTDAARLLAYQEKYSPALGAQTVINNLQLYDFIDEWINVPYQFGGNSKAGIDCSRLSILLMSEVYHKSITGSSADIAKLTERIPKNRLKEGDLVFFKINSDKVNHMGVYLGNGRFIHSTTQRGVVISDLQDNYYSKFFVESGRVR